MKMLIRVVPLGYENGQELIVIYAGRDSIHLRIRKDCPPAELAQLFYALSQAIIKDERLLADSDKPYRKQEKQ